jgi:hypothetical protein
LKRNRILIRRAYKITDENKRGRGKKNATGEDNLSANKFSQMREMRLKKLHKIKKKEIQWV